MRQLSRRGFTAIALAATALPHLPAAAQAALPPGPITLVVGWPAGGPSDNVARLTAQRMAEALGQSIVIDNKGGAGGNIGSDAVSRARAAASVPMLPPAPPLLSMTMDWPSASAMWVAMSRATLSDGPPAGQPTIMVMGPGGSAGCAQPVPAASASRDAAARRLRERCKCVVMPGSCSIKACFPARAFRPRAS